MKKGIPNDVTGKWKMFNNFEKKDHRFNTKKRLEVEANLLVDDLNKARLQGKKTAYDLSPGYYRPPEIELNNRAFAEGARYYNRFEH